MKGTKKTKGKKITFAIIIILLVVIGGTTYYICNNIDTVISISKKQKVSVTQKSSEEFNKEKEYEGMTIKDIKMRREDGITYFTANIENNTEKKFEEKDIKIIFQKEDLTQISILKTHLQSIEVGESVNIQVSTSANLIDAYNFKII